MESGDCMLLLMSMMTFFFLPSANGTYVCMKKVKRTVQNKQHGAAPSLQDYGWRHQVSYQFLVWHGSPYSTKRGREKVHGLWIYEAVYGRLWWSSSLSHRFREQFLIKLVACSFFKGSLSLIFGSFLHLNILIIDFNAQICDMTLRLLLGGIHMKSS